MWGKGLTFKENYFEGIGCSCSLCFCWLASLMRSCKASLGPGSLPAAEAALRAQAFSKSSGLSESQASLLIRFSREAIFHSVLSHPPYGACAAAARSRFRKRSHIYSQPPGPARLLLQSLLLLACFRKTKAKLLWDPGLRGFPLMRVAQF